ncbi:LOW QUALITY PROTEIN: Hypothetical protein PHPALM_14680 [Phytophthora palmivora]|uniref:Uncharacterized protein n=1 Tax=Phytophthora palmivora TaxID=4796 RepID=A0A2P4XU20_9STRA|nr:LOW QUALITY PROTEIN: Hypothetical protein PHPALM_14680 [Phytophthora palmivora]
MPTKAQGHVREVQPSTDDSTSTVPNAIAINPLTSNESVGDSSQWPRTRWSNLKTALRGENSKLGYRAARDSWKMSDRFTLSEDNVCITLETAAGKATDSKRNLSSAW